MSYRNKERLETPREAAGTPFRWRIAPALGLKNLWTRRVRQSDQSHVVQLSALAQLPETPYASPSRTSIPTVRRGIRRRSQRSVNRHRLKIKCSVPRLAIPSLKPDLLYESPASTRLTTALAVRGGLTNAKHKTAEADKIPTSIARL